MAWSTRERIARGASVLALLACLVAAVGFASPGSAHAQQPVAIDSYVYDPKGMLGTNTESVRTALSNSADSGAAVYVAIVSDTSTLSAQQWALETLEKSHAPDEAYLLLIIPTTKQMWYLATPGPQAALPYSDLAAIASDTVVPALNAGNMAKAVTDFNDAVQKRSADAVSLPLWALIVLGVLLGIALLALVVWWRRRRASRTHADQARERADRGVMEIPPETDIAEQEDRSVMSQPLQPKKIRRLFGRGRSSGPDVDPNAAAAPATDMWSQPQAGPEVSRPDDDLVAALRQAGITDPDLLARAARAQGGHAPQSESPAGRMEPGRGYDERAARPELPAQDWDPRYRGQPDPRSRPQAPYGDPEAPDPTAHPRAGQRYSDAPLPARPAAPADGTRYIELPPSRPSREEPAEYAWQQKVREQRPRSADPRLHYREEEYPSPRATQQRLANADGYYSDAGVPARRSEDRYPTSRPVPAQRPDDRYYRDTQRPAAPQQRDDRYPTSRPTPAQRPDDRYYRDTQRPAAPQQRDDRYPTSRPVPAQRPDDRYYRDAQRPAAPQQRDDRYPTSRPTPAQRPDDRYYRDTQRPAAPQQRDDRYFREAAPRAPQGRGFSDTQQIRPRGDEAQRSHPHPNAREDRYYADADYQRPYSDDRYAPARPVSQPHDERHYSEARPRPRGDRRPATPARRHPQHEDEYPGDDRPRRDLTQVPREESAHTENDAHGAPLTEPERHDHSALETDAREAAEREEIDKPAAAKSPERSPYARHVPEIPPRASAQELSPKAQAYLDTMLQATALTGIPAAQVDQMRDALARAAREMADKEPQDDAPTPTPSPAPFDAEAAQAEARQRVQAELEERRRERAAQEAERAREEKAAREREARRARAEAAQRRHEEQQARQRAEEAARAAAAEQRRRRAEEEARRAREREAREAYRYGGDSEAHPGDAEESSPVPAPAPSARPAPTKPQLFAQALREADTLCRTCESSLEVVKVQFGNEQTQSYARALTQARRTVTRGLDMFADAQLNHRPLADDGYLAHLADAQETLRDQAERFTQWRHAESAVEDIVADLSGFVADAQRGLAQVNQVIALIGDRQSQHADLLAADVERAHGWLSQARDLLDEARGEECENARELTERAERAILDALLVAHRVEDWGEYARNQRTREAAADAPTALQYSLQSVVCYMAALEDFMSLNRTRVSLAARTMLMLANKTLTRVESLDPADVERALRLVDQAEQQAEQADRLAVASLTPAPTR